MIQSHNSSGGPGATPDGRKLLGKRIVISSDGTGNSASAVFKTNVWRLYQSLDYSERTEDGAPVRIALYDNGVGTSSFLPLALSGGAFGVGLKRNVLDLYQFICRNYKPGGFETTALCWHTGYRVEEGLRYRVRFDVGKDWADGSLPASPVGITYDEFPWQSRHAAVLLRRSHLDRWFQPIATIVPIGFGVNHSQPLSVRSIEQDQFAAEFVASQDGVLFIFVSDALVPFPGLTGYFYRNNSGTAEVTVGLVPVH